MLAARHDDDDNDDNSRSFGLIVISKNFNILFVYNIFFSEANK